MKKIYYLSIYLTLFITIAASFSFYSIDVSAENLSGFQTEGVRNGIKEVVLNPAAGKVRIYLPDDIRAGDTISGYVIAEPEGKTESERSKNEAELIGYVLEIAGVRQNAWEKVGTKLQSTIKFALTAGTTPTGLLKSTAGTPISNFDVPVSPIGITTPQVSSPTPENYQLPMIGQQGRPVQINGPFDGSFDNTTVYVGGQPSQLLAESPRKAVFKSPEDVTGPTEITMKEGNVEKTAPFRNVGVNLSAPKTNLIKGEKTTLTVAVSGLQGIMNPVPLQLVTTGTVNIQGGNMQNIPIAPGDVNTNGSFVFTRTITGVQAGAFNVTATVIGGGVAGGGQKKCECKCVLNDPPILSGGTAHSYKANVKTATCKGKDCSVSGIAYSWSISAAESTATYTVRPGTTNAKEFIVDITGSGKLHVTVTVTVTCSDGSTCSDTGSKTFDVRK